MSIWIKTCCLGVAFAAGMTPAPASSSALHPSANGHFLVDDSGRPVFLLADTAWRLVTQLKREEMTAYFEHRRSQGFNAIALVLYAPPDPKVAGTVVNAYGRAPFAMANGAPDLSKPDVEYWKLADFAIAEAARTGLYAIVLPCWGSAIVGDYSGRPSRDQVFDATSARQFGHWVGERYAGQSQVLWMLGGDRRAVYGELDFRPVFRALAEGLREGGAEQLMSFHPPKRAPQSGDWFHRDAWLGFNSIQHWPEDQCGIITRDWNAQPAKPTWIFESRYEGYWKNNYKAGQWGEWQCRQQAWQSVLAGGFGFTYGHERVYGFGSDGADWKSFLDAPGATQMHHLADLLTRWDQADLLSRVPDQSLIASDEGKADRLSSNRITAMRNGAATRALFYDACGRPFTVRMSKLAAAKVKASWFNPRDGSEILIGEYDNSGENAFVPPTSGEGADWVLQIQ